MDSAAEEQQHSSSKQQLFDIEAASESKQEQLRQLGRSKLDAVLNKAQAGHDPFEHQERPQRLGGDGTGRWLHPDPAVDVSGVLSLTAVSFLPAQRFKMRMWQQWVLGWNGTGPCCWRAALL